MSLSDISDSGQPWAAYYADGSAVVILPSELEAYRYANSRHMEVEKVVYGQPVGSVEATGARPVEDR